MKKKIKELFNQIDQSIPLMLLVLAIILCFEFFIKLTKGTAGTDEFYAASLLLIIYYVMEIDKKLS